MVTKKKFDVSKYYKDSGAKLVCSVVEHQPINEKVKV